MTRLPSLGIGIGAPGLVDAEPQSVKRPDLCAHYGHPFVTYNPWLDKTWCLCGEMTTAGNHATHADCCGGPLEQQPGMLNASPLNFGGDAA